jgi:hypothetical protein
MASQIRENVLSERSESKGSLRSPSASYGSASQRAVNPLLRRLSRRSRERRERLTKADYPFDLPSDPGTVANISPFDSPGLGSATRQARQTTGTRELVAGLTVGSNTRATALALMR